MQYLCAKGQVAPLLSLGSIDVVVPTFRRQESLARCLSAISRQARVPARVIVSDDGGDASRVCNVHRAGLNLRLLEHSQVGPAANRNLGAGASDAEVIVFLDDDCCPIGTDWLDGMVEPFSNPDVVAVQGRVVPARRVGLRDRYVEVTSYSGQLVSASIAVRRKVFEQVDGFDESFPYPACEDTELGFRLEDRGRIVFAPNGAVVHEVQSVTWPEFQRLSYQLCKSVAMLYAKHPVRFPSKATGCWSTDLAQRNSIFRLIVISLFLQLLHDVRRGRWHLAANELWAIIPRGIGAIRASREMREIVREGLKVRFDQP